MPVRDQVFISYSHLDGKWRERLQVHLKPLQQSGIVKVWADTAIEPGMRWRNEIEQALARAKVAILLVSADFLASDFVTGKELPPLLEAAEKEGAVILSVILSPCRFRQTPSLFQYQSINPPSKPLSSLDSNDQEQTLYEVSLAVEKAMEVVAALEAQTKPQHAAANVASADLAVAEYTNLPDRNPFFTGREGILTEVQKVLAVQGRVALSGLSGIGKTQVAVEFAYRHAAEYTKILWVDASSGINARLVKQNLSERSGWLLILDNAENLVLVRDFFPDKGGHVLLTTCAHTLGSLARVVEVNEMPEDDAVLFFLRRANGLREDGWIDQDFEANRKAARKLAVDVLAGLPLALDQAASYLEDNPLSLAELADRYRQYAAELLKRRGAFGIGHPDPVTFTWLRQFSDIEKSNPAAAELLRIGAVLSPHSIPEELFTGGAREMGPLLAPVAAGPLAFGDALAAILKCSLIRRTPAAKSIEIHPLVQQVIRSEMDRVVARSTAGRAIRGLSSIYPTSSGQVNWPAHERFLPHALACFALIEQYNLDVPEAAHLLSHAGGYLVERGRLKEAEPLLVRALAIAEAVLGSNQADLAVHVNNLAVLYHGERDYTKAEPLYQRALSIAEATFGPGHQEFADAASSLADLYRDAGDAEKAARFYQSALEIRERTLGPDHADVAQSLTDLAGISRRREEYSHAQKLYQRALTIREKALGTNHPDVAASLNGLAELYRAQGDLEKAAPLHERALAIREKALGPNHPDVAQSLINLALLYQKNGDRYPYGPRVGSKVHGGHAEAEKLYKRAIEIREKAFGPDHPSVAGALENYATLLSAQYRRDEAARLRERTAAIRRKAALNS